MRALSLGGLWDWGPEVLVDDELVGDFISVGAGLLGPILW